VTVAKSREEAARIVSDFFEVKGEFSTHPPEGMAASVYPKALARFLKGLDEETQSEVGGVLLEYAMGGSDAFGQAAAYVSLDLAMRGLTTAFVPHLGKITEWFESRLELGWWETDASYESAPPEAHNAISLINVLRCCDETGGKQLTDMLLQRTSSEKLRALLMKSTLLHQARKSVL
jgi:hypothetical protein